MTGKLVQVWIWLAVVMPAIVGLVLLLNPSSFSSQPLEVGDVARMVAIRNLVYSAVFLTVVLTQPKKVIGILLFGRGLTDFADSTSAMLAAGQVEQMTLMPLASSIISFFASYYLLKKSK